MMDVKADAGSEIILRTAEGAETRVPVYSPEGVELLTSLRLKQMAEFKTMYEPTWLGLRMIQVPNDIVAMHELIWQVRPDAIVEIGIAHGGSLAMYAGLCALMGKGKVLGVDIDIRPANRQKIMAHEFAHRIELFDGSSLDRATVSRAERFCADATETVIVLDSNHSASHVQRELDLYCGLVSSGGYLVVMDGGQAFVSDIPRGDPEWRNDNPLVAIHRFLESSNEFEIDPQFNRFGTTSCPDGFLRRKGL